MKRGARNNGPGAMEIDLSDSEKSRKRSKARGSSPIANKRSGKQTTLDLYKVDPTPQEERLISKMKSIEKELENVKKMNKKQALQKELLEVQTQYSKTQESTPIDPKGGVVKACPPKGREGSKSSSNSSEPESMDVDDGGLSWDEDTEESDEETNTRYHMQGVISKYQSVNSSTWYSESEEEVDESPSSLAKAFANIATPDEESGDDNNLPHITQSTDVTPNQEEDTHTSVEEVGDSASSSDSDGGIKNDNIPETEVEDKKPTEVKETKKEENNTKISKNSQKSNEKPKKLIHKYKKRMAASPIKDFKKALMDQKCHKVVEGQSWRFNTSFQCNQIEPNQFAFNEMTKTIILAMDKIARKVDPQARIAMWDNDKTIVLEWPEQLNPNSARQFLGIPAYLTNYGTRRNYKLGIRVFTKMPKEEFINRWSMCKNFKEWNHIAPSEMQCSPTAYPVGMCVGSSPNKDCKTLNLKLEQILGCKAEVSWQNITGMNAFRQKMWDEANKKAKEQSGGHTPTYNRIKSTLSPSGLVVYVAREEDKAKAQVKLSEKFCKGKGGEWPIWPDGSRMKFVPYASPTSNPKALKIIERRIEWHTHSKANEVKIDIDIEDIHEKKTYLGGKSLEEAIYNIKSKEEKYKHLTVFKSIVRRWTRDPTLIKYQVSAFSVMADEAKEICESLKSMLHTQYGNEVLKHFPGQSLNTAGYYEKKYITREEPLSKEVEKYLLDDHDESEGILEPGFLSVIQAEEYGLLGDNSTIHLSKNKEGKTAKVSTPTPPGVLKNNNKGSDDSKTSEDSDDETVDTKFTAGSGTSSVTFDASVEDKVSDPKKRLQLQTVRALAKAKISQDDFNLWKARNDTRVRDIQSLNTKPYRAAKQLISLMKREREEFDVNTSSKNP